VINVLCYMRDFDWVATEWPQQQFGVTGSTKDIVKDSFVDIYNTTYPYKTITAEDCRFFGPIHVSATLRDNLDHWSATAIADRVYQTTGSSEEEAKTNFIALWNEERVNKITDENVDWVHET